MTDPDIIKAAAQALARIENAVPSASTRDIAEAVLSAVTPLIEAATLEEAAQVAEDDVLTLVNKHKIAAAIRALKEQPLVEIAG